VRRELQWEEAGALLPCLVSLEACATAHHWACLIGAFGHQARLIPPSNVKPYVRRRKTDVADTAAICEAVGRPSTLFLPVKWTVERIISHGHFAEFAIIAPVARPRVVHLINMPQDTGDDDTPTAAREALRSIIAELQALE